MDYLIKSCALLTLVYLCYTLFLKKETFFSHNRWFLLIGLAIAFILPLIYIPQYIIVEKAPIVDIPLVYNYVPTETIIIEQAFDWQALSTRIYIIGFILCFIQFLLQFGSLVYLLLKNHKNKDGIYTYVVVKDKISPFSFFKWIVYNPELFNDEELQLILGHERVHARQWHSIDILLSRFACVLMWFNPLIWLFHKDIQQNLEYIADRETQNNSNTEKDYQQLLLKASVGSTNVNLTSKFYNSLIKKRIVMLQKNRSKSINRWKSALIFPFIVLFLMSVNRKNIYEYTEPNVVIPEIPVTTDHIKITIFATSTDTQLKDIKTKLKGSNISMNLKKVKRNSDGKIIQIHVVFTDDKTNSVTNYKVKDTEGISPFIFERKENGSMSVNSVVVIEVVENVIEEPEIIDENKLVIKTSSSTKAKSEGDKFVYNSDNKQKIKNDSVYIIRKPNDNDPIYILNGKRVAKEKIRTNASNNIDQVSVLKGKNATAIYGKAGKNGVIEIITNDDKKSKQKAWQLETDKYSSNVSSIRTLPSSSKEEAKIFLKSANQPLIIINDEVLGNINLSNLDYSIIKEISILKGDKAIDLYGKKAENGAVIIFTNEEFKRSKKNHKKYTAQVSSFGYMDETKPNETTLLFLIYKNTPDSMIKKYVKQLKNEGISAKVSKLKRNYEGEITKIKIKLSDTNGNSSEGTFSSNNGISTISLGKQGDNLVVSSKKIS